MPQPRRMRASTRRDRANEIARRRRAAERAAQRAAREAADWRKRRRQAIPAPDEVVLIADEIRQLLVARLGDGYPSRDSGTGGGWVDIERPGRVSATHFVGTTSLTMRLPLIIGQWPDGWGCERELRILDLMARQPVGAARDERPPLLRLRGGVPHGGRSWFVDGPLEWEEVIVDRVSGDRVRARVIVPLKRHVGVDLVEIPDRRRSDGGAARTHRIRRGETLAKILQDELGPLNPRQLAQARRATLRLNPWLRDPRAIGRHVGRRLKLPRRPK